MKYLMDNFMHGNRDHITIGRNDRFFLQKASVIDGSRVRGTRNDLLSDSVELRNVSPVAAHIFLREPLNHLRALVL